jgi:hypothetical protein
MSLIDWHGNHYLVRVQLDELDAKMVEQGTVFQPRI